MTPDAGEEHIASVIFRLRRPNAGDRLDALSELARIGSPDDLSPVAVLLMDEDARVRKAAADTISAVESRPGLIALDAWLRRPSWEWTREDVRPHVRAARDRLARRFDEPAPIQTAPPPRAVGR